jgi:predicted nucleic acid-binding protein
VRENVPRISVIFPDTNLFVSAIRGGGRVTDSLRLLVMLVRDEQIHLLGDAPLAAEITKYAEAFPSPPAARLQAALLGRLEILEPKGPYVRACEMFFGPESIADLFHAAVCLQTGATLVSNDRHFDRIAAAGLIHRLTVSEAIRIFL